MNYSIEKNSAIPAYLQLYEQLRDDIVKAVYPFGSKLPSKRLTAEETGVSVITVEHAYSLLSDEGYVESRERSGYFVLFQKGDGFEATGASPRFAESISDSENRSIPENEKMSPSSQSNIPFTVLARTMRKVLSDYGEAILERTPGEGLFALRLEISRYLQRSRSIKTSPEQIVIGAGTEYLYNLLIGLLGINRIYGIESPSYQVIEQVYRNSGVGYTLLPLGKDGITNEALKDTKANVLHLTPYRSFPSGVTASASKRHEYIRWAETAGRYLIEDDYESEFSVLRKPEDTLFSLSEHDNVIYLNTFSQSISPSFRVGYMLLPKPLMPQYRKKLGFYSCTVPTAIQYVLMELIRSGDFERNINRVRRKKRKLLAAARSETR